MGKELPGVREEMRDEGNKNAVVKVPTKFMAAGGDGVTQFSHGKYPLLRNLPSAPWSYGINTLVTIMVSALKSYIQGGF